MYKKLLDNDISLQDTHIYNEGFAEALNMIEDFINVSYDVMEDSLEHQNASITERALAQYYIDDFLDTVHTLIEETLCVDDFEEYDVCDEDCENCCLSDCE